MHKPTFSLSQFGKEPDQAALIRGLAINHITWINVKDCIVLLLSISCGFSRELPQ